MSVDEGLQIGRRVKAKRIADQIRKLYVPWWDVSNLRDFEWKGLDILGKIDAGMAHEYRTGGATSLAPCICGLPLVHDKHRPHDAPSPETRALVIEILSREEPPAFPASPPRDEDVPA